MVPQTEKDAEREYERALVALEEENTVAALAYLEKALKSKDDAAWYSCLGYCIAKERGQVKKGADLCLISMEHEPKKAIHCLNLGRVHLVAGNKEEALRVFRSGMAKEGNEQIQRKLITLGMRKPPVIPFLDRDNPLNKYLGLLLSRIGLR